MEGSRLQDKQQCLHYLGDRNETSPEHICKSPRDTIETKLRSLRLRHCCERTALSALHNEAFNAVLNNGSSVCIKTLKDLMETDSLAARITCEFTEILIRYDCRQSYSIIHHCEDCKVSHINIRNLIDYFFLFFSLIFFFVLLLFALFHHI